MAWAGQFRAQRPQPMQASVAKKGWVLVANRSKKGWMSLVRSLGWGPFSTCQQGLRARISPAISKGNCYLCTSCINRCPVQAIQYGEKTKGRGRYVCPEE